MQALLRRASALALTLGLVAGPGPARAFCGFFVGGADATLFNNASQVVVVHDEGNTVLTMVNNYRGEPQAFALVVPVPVVLEKELVRVIEMAPIDHLDAFSAPRLVEYFDADPCAQPRYDLEASADRAPRSAAAAPAESRERAKSLGVTVEATYTVGEYDIVILSAKQSDGLEVWLRENRYNIPRGASAALAPYIRSGMKFFVAKVNLKEKQRSGFSSLRPLQFAFPDRRFMLPIRLGMLNADGPQDLLAYVITKQFRAEVTNYRNPMLPTGQNIPTFVKTDFKRFYQDLFARQVQKENGRAVLTEHAWNMGWCDPCAANPLSADELEKLGVWWLKDQSMGGGQQAFVTRLHARYTPDTFPEDLMLKVTKDANNFQARYVLQHPARPQAWCDALGPYKKQVEQRREQEVHQLALLTGWDPGVIRQRLLPFELPGSPASKDDEWKDRMKKLFSR